MKLVDLPEFKVKIVLDCELSVQNTKAEQWFWDYECIWFNRNYILIRNEWGGIKVDYAVLRTSDGTKICQFKHSVCKFAYPQKLHEHWH